jgi:hypothetical protein
VRARDTIEGGGLAHAVVRGGVGASGGGSGSGSAMPTCRAGKDTRVGVRLGKETDVWATFRGCGPIALGRPEGIVLFFIYSKTFQMDLNRFDQKMTFLNSKNIQIKYGVVGN